MSGPIAPQLARMAAPNLATMLAQAATGLIETWFIGRLGADALAGMALVFPGVMLMQMISGGAMGGGIASAIARALGAGRRDDADALVWHALVVNGALGLFFSAVMLLFGRAIYAAMGGQGVALDAAMAYSNIAFAGAIFIWLMNALASVIRGGGDMRTPALVSMIGVVALIPLSAALILGFGPVPTLGIGGGALAFMLYHAVGMLVLGWYVMSGRNVARLRRTPLRWPLFFDILRVGAVAIVQSLQTNLTIGLATGFVGAAAGVAALAGFGVGARLELLLVPITFGLGGPLVALVGANIGAGQRERAMRIAAVGAAAGFLLCELVGLSAALWPRAWLALFGADESAMDVGARYLRIVGPFFGFFGVGHALYFASQGAGRLFWPVFGGALRFAIAIGGGFLALKLTGSLDAVFAMLALGLFTYGICVAIAVRRGVWFTPARRN